MLNSIAWKVRCCVWWCFRGVLAVSRLCAVVWRPACAFGGVLLVLVVVSRWCSWRCFGGSSLQPMCDTHFESGGLSRPLLRSTAGLIGRAIKSDVQWLVTGPEHVAHFNCPQVFPMTLDWSSSSRSVGKLSTRSLARLCSGGGCGTIRLTICQIGKASGVGSFCFQPLAQSRPIGLCCSPVCCIGQAAIAKCVQPFRKHNI